MQYVSNDIGFGVMPGYMPNQNKYDHRIFLKTNCY